MSTVVKAEDYQSYLRSRQRYFCPPTALWRSWRYGSSHIRVFNLTFYLTWYPIKEGSGVAVSVLPEADRNSYESTQQ
jgi:hypothetical protein